MQDLDELERRKRELELRRDIARLERNERLASKATEITATSLGTMRKVAIGLAAIVAVAALVGAKIAWGSYELWTIQTFVPNGPSFLTSFAMWDNGWHRRLRFSEHSECIRALSSIQSAAWARGNFEFTEVEKSMLESSNYTMQAPRRRDMACVPSGTPSWAVEWLDRNLRRGS